MHANEENPLVPMGALTGKPDRKMISETLSALKEVGITQYLLYPRSGCELEYLSKEWFDTCRIFLEEGKRLGFTSFWLYDEFNWPSGQCGGKIMKENPDYALHYLQVLEKDGTYTVREGRNPDRPNVLNPEAARSFLRSTHEKYAEHFGDLFGGLIKGIFSDEPSFLYVWHGETPGEERLRIACYPGLKEEYAELTGNDLEQDLIFCLKNHCDPFWQPAVRKLLGEQFRKAFMQPIRDWCSAHNLFFTGHLMDESSPAGALRASGRPLKIIDTFSLPGMDEIFTRRHIEDTEWLTLGTVEHGIRRNGNGGLAELFALGPCDMPIGRMKKMIRTVSMFGVDHYVLAVAQLDMRGNVEKSLYFNPYSRTQPWFRALKLLGEDARSAAQTAKKTFLPEIQIRYPSTERPLNELLIRLTAAQRQWALIGEEETASAPFVLRLERDNLVEENSRKSWNRMEQFIRDLEKTSPLQTFVTEQNGSPVNDILLRNYADGSTELVNFGESAEKRSLLLHRNGQKIPFLLEADGTRSFPGWVVKTDRPNLKRLSFENGLCRLTLKEALSGVTLVLRSYGGRTELRMDGSSVIAEKECSSLPQGFRELCRETEAFDLSAGEHIFELISNVPDYPYLPAAFLTGDFAASGNELSKYAEDGIGLEEYIGELIQTGTVELPADAQLLRMETDGLDTELFLNDESLGERAWAPFAWRIPERFAGHTVSVTIIRRTSCAPMFGTACFDPNPNGPNGWLVQYRPQGGVAHPVAEVILE